MKNNFFVRVALFCFIPLLISCHRFALFEAGNLHIKMTNINYAWRITKGAPSIKIAIIDTGIDYYHQSFRNANISTLSYNSRTDRVGLAHVLDDDGHGTAVAGIIASQHHDEPVTKGIAPDVELLIIKANTPHAQGYNFEYPDLIRGIRYAADNGANVINMSIGGPHDITLQNAISYAYSKGSLLVAASGNEGNQVPSYPASYQTVISVASIEKNRTLSSYSSYGTTIDIVAPGSYILTPIPNYDYGLNFGTSMAAPIVSGIIGLMLSYDDSLRPHEVETLLYESAEDLGTKGKDIYFGHGLVDAKQVMRQLQKSR